MVGAKTVNLTMEEADLLCCFIREEKGKGNVPDEVWELYQRIFKEYDDFMKLCRSLLEQIGEKK